MRTHVDYTDAPIFTGPLIPPPDQWPVFDSILMCSFSLPVEHPPSPTPATLAAMPVPPSRTPPRNKNPDHIPRPRNAFMLFRSAFAASHKVSSTIEHDNRHITRIIAHCWNCLSDTDKQVWRNKAVAEKAQHAKRYPDYRFSPVGRAKRPSKRKVRRNGAEDVKRCEKLAELVMAGKFGQDLENAIKEIDNERLAAAHVVDDKLAVPTSAEGCATDPHTMDSAPSDVPPFRSPLLPPSEVTSQQVHGPMPNVSHAIDINVTTCQPLVHATTACHVEPPTFYSPTIPDSGPHSLVESPRFQYYQPNMHDSVPSPDSLLPLDDFQRVMNLGQNAHAELDQSVPDFSLGSWNQSDNFAYYH